MSSIEYENEKLYLKLTNQPLDNYNNHEWKEAIYESEYNFYIEVAETLIDRYLNHSEHEYVNIRFNYRHQTVMLAAHVYNLHSTTIANNQNQGIKSISSNGRSVSFMEANEVANMYAVPQYIKDMLPKPKSRVKVW